MPVEVGSRYIEPFYPVLYGRAEMPLNAVITPPIPETPLVSDKVEKSHSVYPVAEIKAYIRQQAERYGVDPDLALLIAKHESNFDQYAANKKSSAKGIYQFLDSSFMILCNNVVPEDVWDYKINVRCALRVISEGGLSHWTADKNMALVINNYLE